MTALPLPAPFDEGVPDDTVILLLFVAGESSLAARARANLARVRSSLPSFVEIVEIDVLEDPGLAREWRVLVTPVLIRAHPLPIRKVIGDLSRAEPAFDALGLSLQAETA